MILSITKQREIDTKIDELLNSTDIFFPESSILDLANKMSIKVFISDFEENKNLISGMIQYPDEKNNEVNVFLNQDHSQKRQTFTLAHEIGHYVLHDKKDRLRVDQYFYKKGSKEDEEETEANYFAASLLVPKNKLLEIIKETDNLSAIANYFGVSEALIRNRIRWIKMN